MSRHDLAVQLAGRMNRNPSTRLIACLEANTALMELAATDMDTALGIAIDLAVDVIRAYVAAVVDDIAA